MIAFASHPSLRFGPACVLLGLWGADLRNGVAFVESGFNHVSALAPFQPLGLQGERVCVGV